MTDTTVAPAGGAPPAASSEVVIDQAPVTPPQPVGAQTPDKPVGEVEGHKAHPTSRREAIQKAFERANNPPAKTAKPAEKPAQPAVEAKPGHNKPPVETEKEPEGLDLKKRPADQPRGERGQFAPREPQAPAAQQAEQQQAAQQQQRKPAQPLPEGTPYREPPPRMAEVAKRDWAATPETVRGDIHRMHSEFGAAYQQYRGDHETMNSIRHFHDMATQHGTTLERALTNYVTMEQKLRQDVVGGLDVIVNNLNLRTPDGRKLTLPDIANYVLSQPPESHKLMATQNAQQATSHQIGELHQEITGLKNALQQMHNQQQYTYTRSAVDQFAQDHPRLDELGDLIETELKFGFDLETAYRRAELLRPTTQAAQTRTTSAQTRPTDKSISGAPDVAPSNGASRPKAKVGRREAISNAMRAAGVA